MIDLTNQRVILGAPTNNLYLNFKNITLNWQSLPTASSYSIEVLNIVNGEKVYSNTSITETSVTLNIPNLNDGYYEWRVKGINSTSSTKEFSANKFYIDTVFPNQVQNLNNTQPANKEVSFTWAANTDSGIIKSPISYKIEFSKDENFASVIQNYDVASTSYKQSFETGVYYWRVKAVDGAGNSSVASTSYKFTIN